MVLMKRKLKNEGLKKYVWVKYDSKTNAMTCIDCSSQPAYTHNYKYTALKYKFDMQTLEKKFIMKELFCHLNL